MLLVLLMFIYAVVGVTLFYNVSEHMGIDEVCIVMAYIVMAYIVRALLQRL